MPRRGASYYSTTTDSTARVARSRTTKVLGLARCSAGIDDARRTGAMLFRLVCVAVKEEIERLAHLQVMQQAMIVAVREGDFDPFQLHEAEIIVQRFADAVDRLADAEPFGIAVAENEMSSEALE